MKGDQAAYKDDLVERVRIEDKCRGRGGRLDVRLDT